MKTDDCTTNLREGGASYSKRNKNVLHKTLEILVRYIITAFTWQLVSGPPLHVSKQRKDFALSAAYWNSDICPLIKSHRFTYQIRKKFFYLPIQNYSNGNDVNNFSLASETRAANSSESRWKILTQIGIADPEDQKDPYVFGPPGSGSGTVCQRYGSGKNSKKKLDSYVLFCNFFKIFNFMKMYLQKVIGRTFLVKI